MDDSTGPAVLAELGAELQGLWDEMVGAERLELEAVEGTVRAARYRNLDGGPRYHACYELASRETLGSPAWLRVRATPWSARVRPMFTNTRRTMFRSATPPKAN